MAAVVTSMSYVPAETLLSGVTLTLRVPDAPGLSVRAPGVLTVQFPEGGFMAVVKRNVRSEQDAESLFSTLTVYVFVSPGKPLCVTGATVVNVGGFVVQAGSRS